MALRPEILVQSGWSDLGGFAAFPGYYTNLSSPDLKTTALLAEREVGEAQSTAKNPKYDFPLSYGGLRRL